MGIGLVGIADVDRDHREIYPYAESDPSYRAKKHHGKKREIFFFPRFQDFGVGISDVTIDTPPLTDQGGIRFNVEKAPKTYKDGTSLIRSVEYCLNKSIRSNNKREGTALGICRMRDKKALVGERFQYGSLMEKNKDPLEMAMSLDRRCRQRGGKMESIFVPL